MASLRTNRSIKEELPRLIKRHKLSLNKMARQLGVSAVHVWRTCNANYPETFSGELAARAAEVFSLPRDYFPEFRKDFVIESVRGNGNLRDHLYDAALRFLTQQELLESALAEMS
jgi:hypothetical protein